MATTARKAMATAAPIIVRIDPIEFTSTTTALMVSAQALKPLSSMADHVTAQTVFKKLKDCQRGLEQQAADILKPLNAARAVVLRMKVERLAALAPILAFVSNRILTWEHAEQQRIEQERIRLERAAREQAAHDRKDKADALVAAAAVTTDPRAARILNQQAKAVASAPLVAEHVEVVPAIVRAGTQRRIYYSARVVDKARLWEAAIKGEISRDVFAVNQTRLDQMARTAGELFRLPGCELIRTERLAG